MTRYIALAAAFACGLTAAYLIRPALACYDRPSVTFSVPEPHFQAQPIITCTTSGSITICQ